MTTTSAFFRSSGSSPIGVDAVAGVPRDPLDRYFPARQAALDRGADVAVTDDQHVLAADRLARRGIPAAVALRDGEPGEVPQGRDDGPDRPLGGGGGVRAAGVAERDAGGDVGEDVVRARGEDLDGLEAGQRGDLLDGRGPHAERQHHVLDLVRALRQVVAAGPDIGLDAGGQGAELVWRVGQPYPCQGCASVLVVSRGSSVGDQRPKSARRSCGTSSAYSGCFLIHELMYGQNGSTASPRLRASSRLNRARCGGQVRALEGRLDLGVHEADRRVVLAQLVVDEAGEFGADAQLVPRRGRVIGDNGRVGSG